MTRTGVTGAMQTALAADDGEVVFLLRFAFSGGDLRVCTASQDIDWDSLTWEGIGGAITADDVLQETSDTDAQGLTVTLSGVDQSIIQKALTELHIGRAADIYLAHLDVSTGAVLADPLLVFSGYMNDGFQMTSKRDIEKGGMATIRTRLVSKLARLQVKRGLQFNQASHLAVAGTVLMFFHRVPALATLKVMWGPNAAGSVARPNSHGGAFGGPIELPGLPDWGSF